VTCRAIVKHKKFKKIKFDNKKRTFHLEYTSGLKVECPYSALRIRGKVIEAAPDAEVGRHSFYFILENGKKDFVPFDQPLHIAQHPEYVKQQTLYEVTKQLNEFIEREKVSKRELARRLGTSMSQLSRLLDTTNYKKELSRLIELAAMLNYEFKWRFKKAA
jgi:DNA-binding Xre family transcriptional regulator